MVGGERKTSNRNQVAKEATGQLLGRPIGDANILLSPKKWSPVFGQGEAQQMRAIARSK